MSAPIKLINNPWRDENNELEDENYELEEPTVWDPVGAIFDADENNYNLTVQTRYNDNNIEFAISLNDIYNARNVTYENQIIRDISATYMTIGHYGPGNIHYFQHNININIGLYSDEDESSVVIYDTSNIEIILSIPFDDIPTVPNNVQMPSWLHNGGYIHVKNVGRRKIRYYKNGNPYVMVKGKKKKI